MTLGGRLRHKGDLGREVRHKDGLGREAEAREVSMGHIARLLCETKQIGKKANAKNLLN